MKDFNKISDRLYLSVVSPSYNNENAALFKVKGMRFVPKLLLAQDGNDSMVAPLPKSSVKDMGLTEDEFFKKYLKILKMYLNLKLEIYLMFYKTYNQILPQKLWICQCLS